MLKEVETITIIQQGPCNDKFNRDTKIRKDDG